MEANWKWAFANCGSDIRERHPLETHLNRIRDFTGNLARIWTIASSERQSDIAIALSVCTRRKPECTELLSTDGVTVRYINLDEIKLGTE